jgi:hypothetical protein
MRISRAAVVSFVIVALGSTALAMPRPGERFPQLTADDLMGQSRSTEEFVGRPRLLIVIADRKAADAMRAWYIAADERVPPNVARESIISIPLPFFVSTGKVRREAREQVPQQYWQATLLDRGNMAKQLGLEVAQTPYVFVLDERGGVVAAVHANVDSPQAKEIWDVFSAR